MMSRETDTDETINPRLFLCFGQAIKEAFPMFRSLGTETTKHSLESFYLNLFLVAQSIGGSLKCVEFLRKDATCIMPDQILDEILANNEQFLKTTRLPLIGHAPRKHLAVVTCMDCRLLEMFEPALGLKRGDAVELRTAGATIAQPERERAANDLIRSLAGAIYLLDVREVLVIGHTQCGLSHVEPAALTGTMQALGVDPQHLIEREALNGLEGLVDWTGAFSDVHISVKETVEVIRNSPYLPKLPVHGLVIDIETGKLEVVERAN